MVDFFCLLQFLTECHQREKKEKSKYQKGRKLGVQNLYKINKKIYIYKHIEVVEF